MKYLKYFETEAGYASYKNGSDYVTPNVSYVVELANLPASDPRKSVMYNPYVEPKVSQKAGDIVYYVDGSLKTIGYADWDASLGTPIGIITIPEGFAPDGKARMIALSGITSDGTASNVDTSMAWNPSKTDTSLTNYTMVPTTDNVGSTSTGSNSNGYLPSDKFTGATSHIDSVAKYSQTSNLIPSPYSDDTPNPEYYKEISGNNVLSDFSGKANTQTLVGLGTGYKAANACWNYSDGVSTTQ